MLRVSSEEMEKALNDAELARCASGEPEGAAPAKALELRPDLASTSHITDQGPRYVQFIVPCHTSSSQCLQPTITCTWNLHVPSPTPYWIRCTSWEHVPPACSSRGDLALCYLRLALVLPTGQAVNCMRCFACAKKAIPLADPSAG